MKESRFIELVNLYIDWQITAAETNELETEMRNNPRRRAIYRQYCQMHRATKQVYSSFRVPSPDPQPVQTENESMVARFETHQRHRRSAWIYYAGGLAAAACLALALVRLNSVSPQAAAKGWLASLDSHPPAPMPVAPAPEPETIVPERAQLPEPPLGPVSLGNAAEPNYAVMREEERRAFSNQVQTVRVSSLFDDGVFESRQVLPSGNQRVFRGRQTPGQQAEFVGYQFQR